MLCRLAMIVLTCGMPLATAAHAAGERPSWECLPADTAAMIRLPAPGRFLEVLRTRTKFGAIVLTDARMQAGWRLLLDAQDGAAAAESMAERFEKGIATYGLTAGDLHALLRGDTGAGFVVQPQRDGLPPVRMLLAWAEPGEEAARKLVAAARQMLEARLADADAEIKRTDLDMAGYDVTWVVGKTNLASMRFSVPLDVGAAGIEPQPAEGEADPQQIGTTHLFFTSSGGRLLAGLSLPVAPGKAAGDADAADPARGADECKGLFEAFLARHAGGDDSRLAEIMRLPGMTRALPEGAPLVEAVFDPRPLLQAAGDADGALTGMLDRVGAEHLGPCAWRQTFADGRWLSGMFLSMPAPRESLMGILDQDCDPAEVPSFVSKDVAGLTQISLDLGKVYETVREFTLAVQGPEAANMFAAAEAQSQAVLGAEVAKVLSSLGTRHWIVTYPPKLAEALAEARKAKQDGEAQSAQLANRMAVVWQVNDEQPFARLLKTLAPLTGGELQEEQGFRGIRVPNGPAVFLGRDHLVVAIGSESLENTLAAIRTPPAGAASLRESDVVERAAKLMPLEPARIFSVEDATRSGGGLGGLRDMVAAMLPEDVEDENRGLLARLQALLPSAAEVEGMFGAGVTLLRMEEAGMSLKSAWEMSAP